VERRLLYDSWLERKTKTDGIRANNYEKDDNFAGNDSIMLAVSLY
jgi:hypothetical protein